MNEDENKTKDELIHELRVLRRQVAELQNDKVERNLVEDALKESEERFRVIFDNLGDGLLLAEKETRSFLMGNPAIHNMLGYTAEELNCLGLNDIHPEQDFPFVVSQFEKLARREIAVARDIPVRRKDGTVFYADISSSFPMVFNGTASLMGVFRDVTERKRAEETLRESEARYRNIFDNATEGIYQTTPEGRFLSVNPAFARMLGFDTPEALMTDVADIGQGIYVHPEDRERLKKLLAKKGRVEGFETQVYRRDGRIIWISINARVVRGPTGAIFCYEGTNHDITERKRAEDLIRKAEQKYRSIFENAIEGIYQSSPEGRYLEVNPAFARIFGYDSPDELKHAIKNIGDQLYVDSRIREECIQTLQEHDAAVFEVPFRRKDGSTGWLSNNVRAIRDPHGRIIRFEGVAEDITDRKRAEEELRRAHDELEDRVEERTSELTTVNDQLRIEIAEHKCTQEALKFSENQLRFLSSRLLEAQEEERKRIARELHDSIGQSLAAVKFNVENLIQRGAFKDPENLAETLEILVPIIQGAIEDARRIYTGLRPSVLDDLGILATISWFCREFRKTFPHIHVCETIAVEEKAIPEPLKIVIFRVLQEALNNVAKYSRAERVNVTLLKSADDLELTIKDNGKGFDLQDIVSKNAQEKGLGLTGMRERTELSGGTFFIESVIGKGTSIQIRWSCKLLFK